MAATSVSFVGSHATGQTTHIAVVVTGTRGDIMPHVALCVQLQNNGFVVRLVSNAIHHDLARTYDLDFVALKGDPHALIRSAAFRDALDASSNLRMATMFKGAVDAVLEENMVIVHEAVKSGDAVLCGLPVLTECMAIGQKYQIPVILLPLLPFSPSGEIPVAHILPEPSKWTWLNRLTYDLSGLLLWAALGSRFNQFRVDTLHVGPQNGFVLEGIPQVTAFNDVVIPRPADWGSYVHTTGIWHMPATIAEGVASRNYPVLAHLLDRAGHDVKHRPVFVAFEAFPLAEPVSFIRLLHACSVKYGITFIFACGCTDIEAARSSALLEGKDGICWEISDEDRSVAAACKDSVTRVHIVQEVPYRWVLSRCCAAVHHGGSLLTQATMEAGIPNVVFPAFGEHYFWAARVSSLRSGPIIYYPFVQLQSKFEEGLRASRIPGIVARAAALGEQMRAKGDGVQLAAMTLRDMLCRPQHRHCGVVCNWAKDDSSASCTLCNAAFSVTNRRHHCRSCGRLADAPCLGRCHLPGYPENAPQLACKVCLSSRRAFLTSHAGTCPVPLSRSLPDPALAIDVPLDSPTTPMKVAVKVGEEATAGMGSTPLGAFETPHRTPRPTPATQWKVAPEVDSTVAIGEMGSRIV